MTMAKKMIYGVLGNSESGPPEGTVYVASGPALLRAIAAPVIMSRNPFTMGDLRALVGDEFADRLVYGVDPDEEQDDSCVQRPILDTVELSADNINEDLLEDYTWIENAMFDELPAIVIGLGTGGHGYRSALGLMADSLEEFERLMREEGFELVRDDQLIALVENYEGDLQRAFEAKEKIASYGAL